MTRSNSSSSRPPLALIAVSLAMMFGTFLLPAYGQEIDPTWYNPWPEASAQAKTSQGRASEAQAAKSQAQHPAKLKAVSTSETAKARVKKSAKQRPS